jgi:O-antigen ligase like membrane protein
MVYLLFAAGIALSPLGDFLSVRGNSGSNGGDARYSLILRGAVIAGLIVAMLLSGRVRSSNWRSAFLAALAVVVSSVAYAAGAMSGKEYIEQTIFVLKVFSFFVYFAALTGLTDRQLARLEPLVRLALLVYSAAIVVGAVLSIDMFRSYAADGDIQIRSGYKGIVYAQNEASALMIVGIACGYSRVLRRGWRVMDAIFLTSMLVASTLVGTKAAAGGALVVTIAYFYARYSVLGATLRAAIAVAVLAALAFVAYLAIPGVAAAVDLTIRYFTYHYDNAGGDGVLTILLSGRNIKFAEVWREIGRQDYAALLTGGYPVVRYLVEIDGPDLMLSLGLPIFVFYLKALGNAFVVTGRQPLARFGKTFFVILLIVACTAGHVLNSAVISPYLAIIAVIVRRGAAIQIGTVDVVKQDG